jgi:hypothetical protein
MEFYSETLAFLPRTVYNHIGFAYPQGIISIRGNDRVKNRPKLSVLIAAVIAANLVSCGKQYTVLDYFPFQADTAYRYTTEGMSGAAQTVYIDYAHPDANRWQRRIIAPSQIVGECLSYEDGQLSMYYAENYMTYVYDMTYVSPNMSSVVLKEPLTRGAVWKRGTSSAYTSAEPGSAAETVDIMAEITDVGKTVTTPAGTYQNALEVTASYVGTEQRSVEYYAPGVGLVRTETHTQSASYSGGQLVGLEYADITVELAEITENTPYSFSKEFYYPAGAVGGSPSETREISHATGGDTEAAFNAALADYSDETMRRLMDGVALNKASLFVSAGRLRADFNSRLTANMSGLSYAEERAALEALANTVAGFYGAPLVCVTVDGAPYSTANITQKTDEYMAALSSAAADE